MAELIEAMDGFIDIPFGQESEAFVTGYVLPVLPPEKLAVQFHEELATLAEDVVANIVPFIRLANTMISLFKADSLKPALDTRPILSLFVSVTDKVVRTRTEEFSDKDRVATLQNFFKIHK